MSEPEIPSEIEQGKERPVEREPVFNLPPVVLAIIGICVVVHLVRVYWLTDEQDFALLVRTAFIPIRYSGRFDLDFYAFSSPFTYTFLHGGLAHLAINMVWLAAFGSPLANRFGMFRFSLFFAATGLAAVALFWAVHPLGQEPLVGASGAISGMMGAAARLGFRIDRSSGKAAFAGSPLPMAAVFRSRGVVTFLAVWMVINLVTGLFGFALGFDGEIAWEAHIGGFVAGFFGLRAFDRQPQADQGR
ncbi:rhomboid family intramembrane serine protease [Mesorhizobium sp.]|uniref:rhomboid family intramembrane serine protease n=1 Tax=Mesorhizobium sp. TaxID=1871066 RepID=UPI0012177CE6|nr:rhomboid family intramembrane serine protease [Mesorhizobium sp.]TIS58267.1 MAG: rhomboid family intramembrane serine protease [Mesorhizobium sp.]TIS92786.1 MAG: rhomboid family intramembrane serine protease [Mesorhizobium sp.]